MLSCENESDQDVSVEGKMLKQVVPKIDSRAADLITRKHTLFDLKKLTAGPLHVLLPELMADNISDLRSAMDDADVDYQIFFAHKATKSQSFLKKAVHLKVGIDVASKPELCNALAVGFRGDQAECTGIKNDAFLQLALLQKSLLVADSIPELKRILQIKQMLGIGESVNVLARLSEVAIPGRALNSRASKFGIPQTEFGALLEFFKQNNELYLQGLHCHNDEREGDIRAGQLEGMLHLMMESYRSGLTPTIVNIGGGLRRNQLADNNQWSEYIGQLEEDLTTGNVDSCWRGFAYGMRLNEKGKVVGRGQAMGMCTAPEFNKVIREMFSQGDIQGNSNGEFIRDNGFAVYLEPGQALLEQCAFSLFEVIEVKQASNGSTLVAVDGNMYNLSVPLREYVMDPTLITKSDSQVTESVECFVVGNLCREEDFLIKRKVSFHCLPKSGDLICFFNTGAYRIDFENASPHDHPTGMKVVAVPVGNRWQFFSEEIYDPLSITVNESGWLAEELVKI